MLLHPHLLAATPVSCELSISCCRLWTELRCLLAFQVGDAMDSDVSGVSVPLEHSFEVGERVSRLFSCRVSANGLLLTLAPRLSAARTAPPAADSTVTRVGSGRIRRIHVWLQVWTF